MPGPESSMEQEQDGDTDMTDEPSQQLASYATPPGFRLEYEVPEHQACE